MNVPKTIITRILATIFIGLTFCWQSLSAQQGVQDGSQPSGNFWLGGVDADWSSSANWLLGDVSLLPDSSLDAYIGPILDLQSGRFMFPIGPALLDRDFSSPRLRLSAFDGISELTLTGGANYETFAIIGFAPENGYLPSDPIQPAKLILDGCSLSGLWLFVPDSEVVVLSDFVQPEFIWQGVVDKLSIASEQQLEISSLVSVRNEIDNQGIIQIPDGATRRLELVDDTVLFGGGFITLALNEQSILTGAEGASLTNLDNTIFGSGTIDVELFNQGLILVDNQMDVEAEIDNSGGLIEVTSSGFLNNEQLIVGGTIHGQPNSLIRGEFRDVTLTGIVTGGTPFFPPVFKGTLTNIGVLTAADENNAREISFSGPVVLTGTGEIVLDDMNITDEFNDPTSVTIETEQVIRGNGNIGIDQVSNRGIVRAENGEMDIFNDFNSEMSGRIEIAGNGYLRSFGTLSGGVVFGEPGARVACFTAGRFKDITFDGDLLCEDEQLVWEGFIGVEGTLNFDSNSNDELLIDGTVTLNGNGELVLSQQTSNVIEGLSQNNSNLLINNSTIRGAGRIDVDFENNQLFCLETPSVFFDADRTWDNTDGQIKLESNSFFDGRGLVFGGVITAGSDTTVTGRFQDIEFQNDHSIANLFTISGNIDFADTIVFDGSSSINVTVEDSVTLSGGGTFDLTPATQIDVRSNFGETPEVNNVAGNTIRGAADFQVAIVNHGTVIAEGGRLQHFGINNDNGLIEIKDGAILQPSDQSDGVISGGSLAGETGSLVSGAIADTTLSGFHQVGTEFQTEPQADLVISGIVTNNGQLNFASLPQITRLLVSESAVLTGDGTTTFESGSTSSIDGMQADAVLTIDSNVVNQTTLQVLQSVNTTENATIDNKNAQIVIGADSELTGFGVVQFGTITGESNSSLSGSYEGVTFEGTHQIASNKGQSLELHGTITNNAVVQFPSESDLPASINIDSKVTLQGAAGEVVLANPTDSLIVGDGQLLIEEGAMRGSGTINPNVVSRGAMLADSTEGPLRLLGGLTLDDESLLGVVIGGKQFAESGSFEVESGLEINGELRLIISENFSADVGDSHAIMQSSTLINGQFDSIDQTACVCNGLGYEFAVEVGASMVLVVVDEKFIVGDVNCDGQVDLLDVAPFVDLIVNNRFSRKADMNIDGELNLLDVEPFVEQFLD